jgi:prepilin-type N-terminal cleavage/methylation domain-containing protein
MRRRGVTMVEVMIVVAVAGILAALAGPNILALVRHSRARAEASALVAIFNSARAQAITRGFPVVVCLTPSQQTPVQVYQKGGLPSAISAATAQYSAAAVDPDRLLDRHYADSMTAFAFPTSPRLTPAPGMMFLVFDPAGRVSVFYDGNSAGTCGNLPTSTFATSLPSPTTWPVASDPTLTFRVASSDVNLFQEFELRPDGASRLKP